MSETNYFVVLRRWDRKCAYFCVLSFALLRMTQRMFFIYLRLFLVDVKRSASPSSEIRFDLSRDARMFDTTGVRESMCGVCATALSNI